jgi:gliding motility-associated-like protein
MIKLEALDTLTCITKEVSISAAGSQMGNTISYEWKYEDGTVISTSPIINISANQPGDYYLTLVDSNNGCTNTDTVTVFEFKNEVNLDITPVITFKPGQDVQLQFTVNIPNNEIKVIVWTPTTNLSCSDCLAPIVSNPISGTYSVTVEDIFGCIGMAEVRLLEEFIPEVYIPNIIKLSDATNNGFTVFGKEFLADILQLKIFDRWGNVMFAKNNFKPNIQSEGWNGKLNNKEVVQGVYVYLVEVILTNGEKLTFTGDITVID